MAKLVELKPEEYSEDRKKAIAEGAPDPRKKEEKKIVKEEKKEIEKVEFKKGFSKEEFIDMAKSIFKELRTKGLTQKEIKKVNHQVWLMAKEKQEE
jgi:hypothetical protein